MTDFQKFCTDAAGFMTPLDLACWLLLMGLGAWKLFDLTEQIGRYFERKIERKK